MLVDFPLQIEIEFLNVLNVIFYFVNCVSM